MTVKKLSEISNFEVINEADFSREISNIYCCDLLSIVMGRAPSDCAWITVMGNLNSIAVAVLADISCIVLAEGIECDAAALEKAKTQNVNVLKTKLPIYEASKLINV